jgi:hypothetical protein
LVFRYGRCTRPTIRNRRSPYEPVTATFRNRPWAVGPKGKVESFLIALTKSLHGNPPDDRNLARSSLGGLGCDCMALTIPVCRPPIQAPTSWTTCDLSRPPALPQVGSGLSPVRHCSGKGRHAAAWLAPSDKRLEGRKQVVARLAAPFLLAPCQPVSAIKELTPDGGIPAAMLHFVRA